MTVKTKVLEPFSQVYNSFLITKYNQEKRKDSNKQLFTLAEHC